MRLVRYLMIGLVSLILAACGGGGTLENENNGGGIVTPDNYTLTLTLVNAANQEIRQVTTSESGKLRATLRKSGQPVANQLVRFTLSGNIGKLNPAAGTARTDSNGVAEIQLQAGDAAGSAQVVASFEASATKTVSSSPYVFDAVVSGTSPTELTVRLLTHNNTETRQISYFSPAIAEAKLIINGQPAAFQQVNFILGSLGVLNPQNGSAMTNAEGIAKIDVLAGSEAGAGNISVSFTSVSNQTVNSTPFVFTTAGDTPVQGDETSFAIALQMTNSNGSTTQISHAQPVNVTATVTDSLNQPVVNQVVSFTSTLGRIQPAFGTALTNAQGQAQIRITAGSVEGAGSVTARYQGKSESKGFVTAGDELSSEYLLTLSMKNAAGSDTRSVSKAQPGNIEAKLTRNGVAVANQLITLNLSSEIGLLSPSNGTARTNDLGIAELKLHAGRINGAGQINAAVVLQNETVLALPFIFDSLGDDQVVSQIVLSVLDAQGQAVRDVAHATPRTLQALVTENGVPVAFRLVTFSVAGAGEINPTSGRAMTDASGIARVDLRAGFVVGAGEAQGRYTNSEGAVIVSDNFVFTSAGDTPVPGTSPDYVVQLSLTDGQGHALTEISQASPGVVLARVQDKDGQAVVNQVVSFSSTLGRIHPAFGTALTNAQGEAQVRLTAGTVEGAGTLTARYQGVEQTISFRTLGNEGVSSYQLGLSLVDGAGASTRQVSRAVPGRVLAVLTQNGVPVENQLINFSLSSSVGVLSPASGTARTDANGVAELTLLAGQVAGTGQVNAQVALAGETLLALPFIFDSLGDDQVVSQIVLSVLDAQGQAVRDVAHATPRTLQALVTENGVPVAFRLVTFSVAGAGEINPTSGRAMTDASGIARVDLRAGFVVGAGEAQGRYTNSEGAVIVSDNFVFTSAGDTPVPGTSPDYVVQLSLTDGQGNALTEISQASPGVVLARVQDKDGQAVVNQVVSFSSTLGRIHPAFGTALTNAQGEAQVRLTAGTVEGAGTLTARYQGVEQTISFRTVGNEGVSSYQLSLSLVDGAGASTRQVSRAVPGRVLAVLTQNGVPVENQLINFSLSSSIGVLSPASGTARTDANGVAELTLLAGQVAGTGQVNAQVALAGETLLALPFIFDSLGDDQVVSQIVLSVLDAQGQAVRDVAHATPRTLQALVTENGVPVAFRLVTFSVAGAGEINPTSGRAMTDASGIARVDLRAGFVVGAGEAQGRYTNSEGAVIVSDNFVFTSAGDTPVPGTSPDYVVQLSLTDGQGHALTEISQASPGVVLARVQDKDGQAVVNQVVSFSSTLGRIHPAFGTALTNAQGEAQVRLTAGTVEGAGTLTARYQGVEQTISFRTLGNEVLSKYTLALTMHDSAGNPSRAVSKDNQGELSAVLSFDGIPLSNQLISFALENSVGELVPSVGTARTDDNGIAKLKLFAGAVPGTGMVTATYQATGETVVSLPYVFESSGDQSADTLITVEVVDNTGSIVRHVDFANPRKVQVTLTQGGLPAPYRLVQVQTQYAGVINPSSGRAMTDQNGIAEVDLLAGNVIGAGEVSASFTTEAGVTINSDTFTFESEGDTPAPGVSVDFTVALQLVSTVTNTETSEVSASAPGKIAATVRDKDGALVVNKVVSYTSSLGNLRPATGTALTNAQGVAEIMLYAGTAEGAGTITAQVESITSSLGFYTKGDEVDPTQVRADVNFRLLTNCPADFRTSRNAALCTEATSISAEQPGILYIDVKRGGTTVPMVQTLVSATTTMGSISPRTGTAITDSNGIALLDLVAGREVGAGEVTVTVANTSQTKAFEIGAVDVDIVVSSSLAANTSLSAGSTALISVDILRNNAPYMPPLTVEFTSGCVQAGLAVIDATMTSIGGVAKATYRASGCVGADLVTATVITGGNTVSGSTTIDVSASALGSIEFIDVSEPIIALKGTGGSDRSESSVVRFRLVDDNGNVVAGRLVTFTLSTAVGGIELAQTEGYTNAAGIVQTVVRAGLVPTPIRVIARSEQTVGAGTVVVSAPSDVLAVTTGVADQNSFSISKSASNVHGLNVNGTTVTITAYLADHFNNPVPNGTAVTFITEGGAIEPSCVTTNGICAVTWRSQNPRPFTDSRYANSVIDKCDGGMPCPLGIVNDDLTIDYPLGGRSTVLAYAVGEESFSDLNGNGRFDAGEFVTAYDLSEAFIDHNEDGRFGGKNCTPGVASDPCAPENSEGDEFEEFIDFNSNGNFDTENGLYNGLLCREEDAAIGLCSRELVHIFQNQTIIMSGAEAYMRLVTYANDCAAIPGVVASEVRVNSNPTSPLAREVQSNLASRIMCNVEEIDLTNTGATQVPLRLFITDVYNNPLPVGTTVEISADNGLLSGTTSYTFPNTTSRVPEGINFTALREITGQGNSKPDGLLTVTVTAPSGLVSTLTVPVTDDR